MDFDFEQKLKPIKLKVFENDSWIWTIRPKQVTLGSSILSLKRTCYKYSELSEKEFSDLNDIIKRIENTLSLCFSYDKINYLMLMMVDKQVHFHVIPRYKSEIQFWNVQWRDYSYPFFPNLEMINDNDVDLEAFSGYIRSKLVPNMGKKYNIGYTTGVFDMFHVGHLNLLKRAKEMCDFLVVGVTTDELVSYKNKQAIIPHVERMKIVESIKFVDQVVSQESMDKMSAWEKIHFDVMFVGSDWKGTNKWNDYEKQFNAIGVDIVYFPYTEGTSSTKLREKLDKIA